jgi:hypothetical protein
MNAKLFINYRREDTAPYAGRLYDRLTAHFGEDQVFIDIDQIEPGEDFVEAINRKVGTCDIAIVAIGPNWLRATDASGKRRLDDEEDFVRMEIVAALQREIRIIPVLVGGARMPGRHELPEALAPLSRRNAIELSETRFHADVNRLIEAIEKSFAVVEKKAELPAIHAAPLPEPAAVRPPEPESKDLLEPSESTKPAGPKEPKEIDADAVSGRATLSEQDRVATVKDSTTPVKSTQTTPTPPPVLSTSSIAALKEPKVWTSERRILVSAIVLFLLALAGLLMWPDHQKAAKQANQPAITDLNRPSKPTETQFTDQGSAAEQYNLGLRYEKGEGSVPKDLGKAAELYQKAADQGYADARFRLGRLYHRGEGVPKDLGKAAELYQKAADQGNALAQNNLGLLYDRGEGVPKDLGKAAELYQKAADKGYAAAQNNLGLLCQYGAEVTKDLGKAAELYRKAADQGNQNAIANLKKLSGFFTR